MSTQTVIRSNVHGATALHRSELLQALQAVRSGDFSVRLPGDQTGLDGKIADTFNEIVAANARLAAELKCVGHVVGKKGETNQRVMFQPLGGEWSEMEVSINGMIDDLLWPTTEVTRAVSAVAQGDLLRKVPLEVNGRPLEGEFLRSASIVNTMIQQLVVFTSEVTRVAREVGTDGKLGGQAEVPEVSGVWKDLTQNVNLMASNLTAQVRNISEVTIAVASGDLSKKITVDVRGEILQLKEAINTMVDQLRSFASEVTRVAREVGTEGRLGGQALVPGVAGTCTLFPQEFLLIIWSLAQEKLERTWAGPISPRRKPTSDWRQWSSSRAKDPGTAPSLYTSRRERCRATRRPSDAF